MSIPHFLPQIVTPVQQMRAHLFTYTLNTGCPTNLLVAPSITITGNVKGTQIIMYAAWSTDPRHFSIFEPCCAFCFLAKKMMADGCSPSAIQAEGNRQYRLLEDGTWNVYKKIAEQANKREEKEAKSKEAQVNRLIASIQANVRVLISVLCPQLFRLMCGNPAFRMKKSFAPGMLSPSNYSF